MHVDTRDLGCSQGDRAENIRRIGEVARPVADAELVAFVPVTSPYRRDREQVRFAHNEAGIPFLEIFVDTPWMCARNVIRRWSMGRAGRARSSVSPGSMIHTRLRPKPNCVSMKSQPQLVRSLSESLASWEQSIDRAGIGRWGLQAWLASPAIRSERRTENRTSGYLKKPAAAHWSGQWLSPR